MSVGEVPRLCSIVLAAEGRAELCPEEGCAYWQKGCVLAGIESDLLTHADVARLLLQVRRELEQARREEGREEDRTAALESFHRRLAVGRE